MRHNLFWKLALTFFALLLGVSLATDFFAERALREDYDRTAFAQLAAIAHVAQARPPHLSTIPPAAADEIAALRQWVEQMAASGAREPIFHVRGLARVCGEGTAAVGRARAGGRLGLPVFFPVRGCHQHLQVALRRLALLLVRVAAVEEMRLLQEIVTLRMQPDGRQPFAGNHCLDKLWLGDPCEMVLNSLIQLAPFGVDCPVPSQQCGLLFGVSLFGRQSCAAINPW